MSALLQISCFLITGNLKGVLKVWPSIWLQDTYIA